MSGAGAVLEALKARQWTLALAESCTGGMVAAALTDIPGASAVFDRAFVTYSNDAKVEMLGVLPDAIAEHGAVSEIVAAQMAEGALTRSKATLALSVTGIAGPGGSEHKPEGLVCFGIALRGAPVHCDIQTFGPSGRHGVRQASVDHALSMILAATAETR